MLTLVLEWNWTTVFSFANSFFLFLSSHMQTSIPCPAIFPYSLQTPLSPFQFRGLIGWKAILIHATAGNLERTILVED
jgi:hypothetical protein